MNRRHRGRWASALVCSLLLLAPACTEHDEQLVENVGVARLYLVDPGILPQDVESPDTPPERHQVTEWRISEATLDVAGSLVDLVAPADGCSFTDTLMVTPVADGPCDSGVVVESSTDPFEIHLLLTLDSMQVRRGKPDDDLGKIDPDGDGIESDRDGSGSAFDAPCGKGGVTFDCDDNCPLVWNADQADDNGDGVGNACTDNDPFLGPRRDSDADGVADQDLDNCVAEANGDQADTTGPSVMGSAIPDGIGDACEEQVATVTLPPDPLVLGPATLFQSLGSTTFITVDFGRAIENCQWDAGTCELNPLEVELCGHTSIFDALTGCP